MKKAILFDLDGTLLPMDTKDFTRVYFGSLSKELAPLGIEPTPLLAAIMAATRTMVKNDGSRPNKEVFWEDFEKQTGMDSEPFLRVCDRYYGDGFHAARIATKPNPLAKEVVQLARQKGCAVVLATNPLFPMVGQATRLSWLELTPEDFDLVTCYETDHYCKPNPLYYRSICERIGVDAKDCLMIGNDQREDMLAAGEAGIDGWLITDCLIPDPAFPWDGTRLPFHELPALLKQV